MEQKIGAQGFPGPRSTSRVPGFQKSERSKILKPLSTPYNRALHWFALWVAFATFLLIVAGALVTSNDAGLSVPDWPTSFGSLYRMPPMVGGVQFEHGHRMIAEFIGLLTVILAFWTWRAERRQWMRKLALSALVLVIVQGVFGGVTVLTALPPAVSSAHAALGQAFFCLAVAIGLFTGRRWMDEEPHTEFDPRRPTLPALAWFSVAAIYVQLILGAMFRHHGMKLLPHLVMAGVVAVIVVWAVARTLAGYAQVAALRRPATALLALLLAQLTLGFLAYMTRIVWNPNASQPSAVMVASTVAHVSVGALLLASAVVLAIQSSRRVPVAQLGRAPRSGRAVTA